MSVSAYDRVRAAREKNRPTGLDYIHNLFGTFPVSYTHLTLPTTSRV